VTTYLSTLISTLIHKKERFSINTIFKKSTSLAACNNRLAEVQIQEIKGATRLEASKSFQIKTNV
jgi:hypothetical protein